MMDVYAVKVMESLSKWSRMIEERINKWTIDFSEKSLESCIFCATQGMYQRMQMKDPNGGNIRLNE